MNKQMLDYGLESKGDVKPLAIIIKGNPKYLEDPIVSDLAKVFYKTVRRMLREQGYRVRMDAGEEYTIPSSKAAVWLAHSRGAGRLKHAPVNVKTYELKTKAVAGLNPDHYVLSDADIKYIHRL